MVYKTIGFDEQCIAHSGVICWDAVAACLKIVFINENISSIFVIFSTELIPKIVPSSRFINIIPSRDHVLSILPDVFKFLLFWPTLLESVLGLRLCKYGSPTVFQVKYFFVFQEFSFVVMRDVFNNYRSRCFAISKTFANSVTPS